MTDSNFEGGYTETEQKAFAGLVDHWRTYFSLPESERSGSVEQWEMVILFGLGDIGIKGASARSFNSLAITEAQMLGTPDQK